MCASFLFILELDCWGEMAKWIMKSDFLFLGNKLHKKILLLFFSVQRHSSTLKVSSSGGRMLISYMFPCNFVRDW